MKARSAARELVLMTLSQLKLNKYDKKNVDEIVLSLVRTITNNAESELKGTIGSLIEIKDFIENYETEHSTNIERPIDVSNLPVPIPMTSDMVGRIDSLVNVAEKSFQALEIAEMAVISNKKDVKDYIEKIISQLCENKKYIDDLIGEYSSGWNIDRLIKIDKSILRIAVAELMYLEDVPVKVSVDEAVELAKKYSNEESSSFINGILGKIIKNNNITK